MQTIIGVRIDDGLRRLVLVFGMAVAALALQAGGAAAQSDAEGCRDGTLARQPGFYLNDCDPPGQDHYVFAEGSAQQQDVKGQKTRLAYALKDGAAQTTGPAVLSAYASAFAQGGWTVLSRTEDRYIVATRGGQWAQVETNGGANYQIVYVSGAGGTASKAPATSQAYALTCSGGVAGTFAKADGLTEAQSVLDVRQGAGGRIPGLHKVVNITLTQGDLSASRGREGPSTGAASGPQACTLKLSGTDGSTLVSYQIQAVAVETLASGRGVASVRLRPESITLTTGP